MDFWRFLHFNSPLPGLLQHACVGKATLMLAQIRKSPNINIKKIYFIFTIVNALFTNNVVW
jgi:hypothetical protein